MTPEEDPFIDGLVAAPADEALRLVYSDWLEEHGDEARASYLRAEVAHLRTPWEERPENIWREEDRRGDKWWEMPGVGIDPVWAVMVCRAPIGILVPGLTFSDTGPKITRADLKVIEDHWGQPLPPDYAAFMLLYNGSRPSKSLLSLRRVYHGDGNEMGGVRFAEIRFFSLGELDEFGRPYDRKSLLKLSDGYIPPRVDWDIDLMMPIGTVTYDHPSCDTTLLTLLLEPGEEVHRCHEFQFTTGGLFPIENTHHGTFLHLINCLVERNKKKKPRKTKKKPLPPLEPHP